MADPGPALTVGVAAGALRNIKIDNMQLQHAEWAAGHEDAAARGPLPPIGLVAVASGPGIAAAFRELGAVAITPAGSGKPSPGAFLEAARRAGERHVFLLPNDKDAIMAAEQAAREAPDLISVVPARSLAAGMSAAVAFQPDGDPEENAQAMRAAIKGVRCIEVSRAGRDADIGGVAVKAGDSIALLDGVLIAGGGTLEEALLAALAKCVDEASELLTLYLGEGATHDAGERVRALIEEAYPGLAVEVVAGGQPHYPYVVGVE
jgi:dihydroxyacetone kinase-like predicted kinase